MQRHLSLLLIFSTAVIAFPAENGSTTKPVRTTASASTSTATTIEAVTKPAAIKKVSPLQNSTQSQKNGSESASPKPISENKKQTLTYVLGQPKKPGVVSSPAQFLSPDRYEFYTFDDDGQIIKKLMSVKEIQKIIANTDKGSTGEASNPIEYYQILSVSPDVESLPAVSRINPNEPLFSIHDVIASVQNVLKSEIQTKQQQQKIPVASVNSTNASQPIATTEKATTAATVEVKKVTPSQTTVTVPKNVTKPIKATTYRPKTQPTKPKTTKPPSTTAVNKIVTTEAPKKQTAKPVKKPAIATTTKKPVSTTKKATARPITTTTTTTTTSTTTARPVQAVPLFSQPLSLADAHPAFTSNESFADMLPIITESLVLPLENVEVKNNKKPTEVKQSDAVNNYTLSESNAMTQVQIPINQDLAESVSSVLSQIASEISMNQFESGIEKNYTEAEESTTTTEAITEAATVKSTLPLSWLKTTEVPVEISSKISIQNLIIPQNQPRPFQKPADAEKLITSATGTAGSSVNEAKEERTTTVKPVESETEIAEFGGDSNELEIESKLGDELIVPSDAASTEELENISVTTISYESVTQSEEHVKPITPKIPVEVKNETKVEETISGVQVVQEGNTGRIPRPTEKPDAIREADRIEITTTEIPEKVQTEINSSEDITEATTLADESSEELESPTERSEIEENETTTTEQTTSENYEEENSSSVEKLDISFVPMVIKASTEDSSTEVLDEEQEQTEKTNAEIVEELESKILPENDSENKNQANQIITANVSDLKTTALTVEPAEDGSLKQNTQYKPSFGKPQKPVFVKPSKIKPQQEAKPTKPLTSSKPLSSPTKEPVKENANKRPYENHLQTAPSALELDAAPDENLGLEATTTNLDPDVRKFADLCNELAFSLWSSVTHNGLSFVRSVVVSPFAVTSLLAMVFLGARGPTSGQMNDVLKLDDMVTFNPHLVFRNVTESLVISRNPGVSTAAFVRVLYSDKSKGKLLDFYKERAQQFYDGHVEEINFKGIVETLRRQTNHLVKRQTWGKITDFLRGANLALRPPLAAFSANIFQTDCSKGSTKERDGEMYFVILPASRLRRLVPVPAVVYREGFLAGYEPNLDATAVSLSPPDSVISTIFVLPGQQGLIAPGDSLARLEHHLLGASYRRGHWTRLMKSLLPRPGLELQIPRLSHKSVINVTTSLQRMGLRDLFSAEKADLTGLNGLANDLHLSDMLQVNLFSTCGEEPIGARHHSEIYPATPLLRKEKSADNIFSESIENLFAVSDFEDPTISAMPLELRPRQARIPLSRPGARIPEPPRLRFDRPFLFFVRHNPTGLILHMGRFNPRLMP